MRELPEFPWSVLAPVRERALRHPGGVVNLALGTPVDPVPDVVQRAVRACTDTPGHPATEGTPRLRAAAAGYLRRRFGVTVEPSAVLPVVGTKEAIAWLPAALGLGAGDRVAYPALSFPTYDVSARLAGAESVPVDVHHGLPAPARLLWLNSPGNPDGRVLGVARLRELVAWGRANDVIVVNDECYLEHAWDVPATSILHPDVCGGSHTGVLAVHSLSKRSNLAGYRAGFVTGDETLVRRLLEVRRHAGLIMPEPIAAGTTAALEDDTHVDEQRGRYLRRRDKLRAALEGAGLRVEHSEASLFLWCTRDEPCWDTVMFLAGLGILVAPGVFYGDPGHAHVRVALTATDERVDAAVERLSTVRPGTRPAVPLSAEEVTA
ncbi:succinyldiaminopimelate transaminase [Dactylosporangium aurantiacum]|uniref:Aminotransferase n=1 Tax=Dactylosporangium aurantiacum TaxID=35754 RepID=A0A9Q9MP00_9ACTN|nr:succinyldiaminopimelate transaminase [Dactylosporangium aurantiacum]